MATAEHHPDAETDPVPDPGPAPGVADSIEQARLYRDIKARLFDAPAPAVRIGPYAIVRRLGRGGMGEVYLAHDEALDRSIALKLVHARLCHDPRFAARMRREARALAKLTHPNVVRVYEVGEHDGRVFLTMEYVEGQSLGAWVREQRPSWREVLDAYLDSGRGLAAAHRAGLTHRDFKPDNVLRGTDGRICVADFGLARVSATPLDMDSATEHSRWLDSGEGPPTLDGRLSATGAVMGTLSYMPLEQMRGGLVDARSDQFAFCVALYEGLWHARPFPAKRVAERERLLAGDRPRAPPRGVAPRWLWPILRRGLARDPSARWPDLETLLQHLARGASRRRGRRLAGLTLAAPLTVAAAWFALADDSVDDATLCALEQTRLDGIWDADQRRALREALTTSGLPSADQTATQVERSLDAWTSSWLGELQASCRATRIEGRQSEAMLDRRDACLARQLGEVAAVVDAIADAEGPSVARAGQAVLGLPDLGACGAIALDAGAQAVVEAPAAAELDEGYRALSQARALLNLGRAAEAIDLAETARRTGDALEHAPLVLEAESTMARIELKGGALDLALARLRESVLAAERAGELDLAASLRVQLARSAAGVSANPELEAWAIDEAQLALDRVARPDDPREVQLQVARARLAEQAGDFSAAIAGHRLAYALAEGRLDDARRTQLRHGIGTALYRSGDYGGAREELEASLAATRSMWGRGAPEAARIEHDLGLVATDVGEFDRARRHLQSALTIDEQVWGAASLEVARDRFALAYLDFGVGDIDAGCEAIERVLSVYAAELGDAHDETASALNAASTCRYYAGDYAGALRGYQRALATARELLGDAHREVGMLHANVGEAQFALGRLDAALASYGRGLEILEAALSSDHAELALPLKGQGLVWLELGEPLRALPVLERALQLADNSQAADLAELRFGVARARGAVDADAARESALALARQARQTFEHAGLDSRVDDVDAWIAQHRE